jgi:hypothetical protein
VLSLRDSLRAAPPKVLGDITAKITPNGQENSDAPTRSCVQWLKSKRVSSNRFSRTRSQCFLSNPPNFFLQKAHSFDSKTSTRPTFDVSCNGCSQRHQGQGVQKVCPARMSSGTLRARKKIPSKKQFLLSRVTRVSRLPLG